MAQNSTQIEFTEQNILNNVYDKVAKTLAIQQRLNDGQNYQTANGENLAIKMTQVGDIVYLGTAAPGTSQASAFWQACKIDSSSGTVITWADGNGEYDNVATDLTALSYS